MFSRPLLCGRGLFTGGTTMAQNRVVRGMRHYDPRPWWEKAADVGGTAANPLLDGRAPTGWSIEDDVTLQTDAVEVAHLRSLQLYEKRRRVRRDYGRQPLTTPPFHGGGIHCTSQLLPTGKPRWGEYGE
mgnify:FL=1